MEQLNLTVELSSKSRVIASSGPFQIELMNQVGLEDHPQLIEISHHLASEYGEAAILTKETINKYFNKQGSLPFIARYRGDIIGYIIGVALEELSTEPWARMDENFSKQNTLYTYAFVIMSKYKGNGYAKILKRDGRFRVKINKDIPMSNNNFYVDSAGNIFSSNGLIV